MFAFYLFITKFWTKIDIISFVGLLYLFLEIAFHAIANFASILIISIVVVLHLHNEYDL